jgi:hypothetical protein
MAVGMVLRAAVCQNLPADVDARGADIRGWSRQYRPVLGRPFTTEGAPHLAILPGKRQGAAGGGQAPVGKLHTHVADEYVWPGDELGNLVLRTYAESAGKIASSVARAPNPAPPAPARAVHHLLHALVAQVECLGNLPQGSAGQMHAADDRVVLRASLLNLVLQILEFGSRSSCRFQQLFLDGQGAPFVYSL